MTTWRSGDDNLRHAYLSTSRGATAVCGAKLRAERFDNPEHVRHLECREILEREAEQQPAEAAPAPVKRATGPGPKNARQTRAGRLYEWRSPTANIGDPPERFWSVTTILKGGLPSPALTAWGMKAVAEYAVANHRQLSSMLQTVRVRPTSEGMAIISDPDAVQAAIDWLKGSPYRERDRKGDIGSAVHAAAEAHILGKPWPAPDGDVAPYLEQFRRFLDEHKPEFELAEATVYNRTEAYAGTLDAIAVIPGRGRALIDYKTSGRQKDGKPGVYPEHALQLAMYRFAEFIGLPDGTEAPMPAVDGCAVLWLAPDDYELVPVTADEQVFLAARYVRETFRWMEELSKSVVGQALPAPSKEATAA